MADADSRGRSPLLNLAAEGVIPVLGGCAGALAAGPEGGMVGVAVGQAVEKAINFFGARIVRRWADWWRGKPPAECVEQLAQLAALSPDEARRAATELIDELAPDADPADRSLAIEYLAAIPRTVDRAFWRDPITGTASLSIALAFEQPEQLLQLLPADVPPYPVPSELPGTPYRLTHLLGTGGFGAVYRAHSATLQHLPL